MNFNAKRCQKCGDFFQAEWIGSEENGYMQDKLCYSCFEDSLEDYEDNKRERIARENEY